jgi:hypothetical protein
MKNKKLNRFLSGTLVTLILLVVVIPAMRARAATLTNARDYMNRNAENLTSSVTHEVIFTPATNVSGGSGTNKIILVFPDADDGKWCYANAGDGTVATTSLHDSATALPGTTKTVACTKGSGSSSYDTITISGVDNLTAGTMYGFRIADGSTEKFGTPANTTTGVITVKTNNGTSDVDTRNIVVDIVASDQISISGTVDPTMTLAITDTQIGFGSITSAAVRHATSDEAGAASEPANDAPTKVTVSTNAQSGMVVEIRDYNANSASGLYSASASHTLTSTASTGVTLGADGFGVYGKHATSVTIAEAFDNDSTSDLAISNTFQTIASTTAPVSSGSFDIASVAAVAGSTPAGSYADTLTVVATGKF